MESEKKLLVPKDNHLQISVKKDAKFFTFLAKIFLKEFQEVELHALGEAISTSVRVAETLDRFGYAKIIKIQQFTQEMHNEKTNRDRRVVKMVVTLSRSSDFHQKTENLKKHDN